MIQPSSILSPRAACLSVVSCKHIAWNQMPWRAGFFVVVVRMWCVLDEVSIYNASHATPPQDNENRGIIFVDFSMGKSASIFIYIFIEVISFEIPEPYTIYIYISIWKAKNNARHAAPRVSKLGRDVSSLCTYIYILYYTPLELSKRQYYVSIVVFAPSRYLRCLCVACWVLLNRSCANRSKRL